VRTRRQHDLVDVTSYGMSMSQVFVTRCRRFIPSTGRPAELWRLHWQSVLFQSSFWDPAVRCADLPPDTVLHNSESADSFPDQLCRLELSLVPLIWVVWWASLIRAWFPISLTQSSDNLAASRKPRARSIRVMADVMRLVIVNIGLNPVMDCLHQLWPRSKPPHPEWLKYQGVVSSVGS